MKGTSPSRVIRAVAVYGIEVPRWEVRNLINSLVCWKGKSMAIVSVGIDLAKNVFAVHGVDATGKAVLVRPNVPRAKLLELIASLEDVLSGTWRCARARVNHVFRLYCTACKVECRREDEQQHDSGERRRREANFPRLKAHGFVIGAANKKCCDDDNRNECAKREVDQSIKLKRHL
jgi:hypothetical protein